MKAHELRPLTESELYSRLDEGYQELFNLRFQKATGQMTNTARARDRSARTLRGSRRYCVSGS